MQKHFGKFRKESALVNEKVLNVQRRVLSQIVSSLIQCLQNKLELDERCYRCYWFYSQLMTNFSFIPNCFKGFFQKIDLTLVKAFDFCNVFLGIAAVLSFKVNKWITT